MPTEVFSETLIAGAALDVNVESVVKSFSLPKTPKNDFIIQKYYRVDSIDCITRIPVMVLQGNCQLELDVMLLNANAKGISSNEWEVTLISSALNWREGLKECLLCSLEYEPFQWEEQNIRDNFVNQAQYVEGVSDAGYYFPLIDYGGWENDGTPDEGTVSDADWRACFHLLPMLQKAFCKLGFKFRCPILESDVGRHIGAYLWGDYTKQENTKAFQAKAVVEEDFAMTGNRPNDSGFPYWITSLFASDEAAGGYDSGQPPFFYNNAQNAFSGLSGVFCFQVNLLVTRTSGAPSEFIYIRVKKTNAPTQESYSFGLETTIGQINEYEFISEQFTLGIGDTVRVELLTNVNSTIKVLAGSCVELIPKSIRLSSGMSINPATLINTKYTAYNLLEGFSHVIDGRPTYDELTNCVTLLSAWGNELGLERLVAYYNNNAVPLPLIVDAKNCTESIDSIAKPKKVILGFCEPEDEWVKSKGYNKDRPLYGKVYDYPNAALDEVQYEQNPFFEAWLYNEVPAITGDNSFQDIVLPAFYDNYDIDQPINQRTKISYDIKPKLMIFGLKQDTFPNVDGTQSDVTYSWNGIEQAGYGGGYIDYQSVFLGYQSTAGRGFAQSSWDRTIAQQFSGKTLQVLALLDIVSKRNLNYRNIYEIEVFGRVVTAIMLRVSDYRCDEKITTPIDFQVLIQDC